MNLLPISTLYETDPYMSILRRTVPIERIIYCNVIKFTGYNVSLTYNRVESHRAPILKAVNKPSPLVVSKIFLASFVRIAEI